MGAVCQVKDENKDTRVIQRLSSIMIFIKELKKI